MSRQVWSLVAMVVLAACGAGADAARSERARVSTPRATAAPIWVLAPHPDDEALMAAQVIASATREGRPVFVHVMTNGDLGCERDGWLRQRETVAAMRTLGLAEARIRFLGYPDGWLGALGSIPLPPLPRRLADGRCAPGATTYGARGEAHADVHTARTGRPGSYTAENAIADLAYLLERDRPSDVYVSHPLDRHPDHATTYVLFRRALERARSNRLPRVHRAIVHAGGCWPNGSAPAEPCPDAGESHGTPYPPLPEPLARYAPDEHVPVPDGGSLARRAIAEYRSQLHTDVDHDWLGDFARAEAIYWTETLVRRGDRVMRAPSPGATPAVIGRLEPGPAEPADRPGHLRAVHTISHRGPLRVHFEAVVPEGGAARVHLLADADERTSSGYAFAVIDDRELEVRRSSERVLRRIAIPDDGARHARHRWELRFDPRLDEGVIEIEVRRDGALLAVVIDPEPFVAGERAVVRTRGGATLDALTFEDGAQDVAGSSTTAARNPR